MASGPGAEPAPRSDRGLSTSPRSTRMPRRRQPGPRPARVRRQHLYACRGPGRLGPRVTGAPRLHMKLITTPDEGIKPVLAAVKAARRRLAIVIFRFDLDELEDALAAAVKRG